MKRYLILLFLILITSVFFVIFRPVPFVKFNSFIAKSNLLVFNNYSKTLIVEDSKYCLKLSSNDFVSVKQSMIPLFENINYISHIEAKTSNVNDDCSIYLIVNGIIISEFHVNSNAWQKYYCSFNVPKRMIGFGPIAPLFKIMTTCSPSNTVYISDFSIRCMPLINFFFKPDSDTIDISCNLLKNSNFQNGFLSWLGHTNLYKLVNNNNKTTIYLNEYQKNWVSIYQNASLISGVYYRISADVFSPTLSKSSCFIALGNNYLNLNPTDHSSTGCWRTVSRTVQILKTGNISFVIQYMGTPNLYINNISLERVY